MQTQRIQTTTGIGQLSLVEHALCPLDSRVSLTENLVYETAYAYSAGSQGRKTARVRIFCPLGLSASDELTLWGLLALTLMQREPNCELMATPHWCLRQLGMIDQRTKRGGRQYKAFAESVRRLSAVSYQNDRFYDPLRAEHRLVSFHFFSYSLPSGPLSNRAWRICWDPLFFEMVKAAAGHFRFDLATYRELDPASRRLFLFVCKVLSRRTQLRALPLEQVAVDLLGFSPTLATRDRKAKVTRCLRKLVALEVLREGTIFRGKPGNYFVRLTRGNYFTVRTRQASGHSAADSPLFEPLRALGFEEKAASRLIRHYPQRLLSEWLDITQAALERKGSSFFSKSPMAFLVDSVKNAAAGNRTAPDWWLDIQKAESRTQRLSSESKVLFDRVRGELFESKMLDSGTDAEPEKKSGFSTAADVLAGI